LRDHAGVLSRAVAAMRIYRLGPAGRVAGGGAAARRGAVAGGSQGTGGYSGPARHDPDRSASAQIIAIEDRLVLARRSAVHRREPCATHPRYLLLCAANLSGRKGSYLALPETGVMTDQAIKPADDPFDLQDVERRIKAIFIGSIGNLVEWYDFYAYTAFALYFAPAFFPNSDPVVQQLNAAVLFAATFLMRPLGGWLFGFIADRHGRRLSLTLS